MKIRRYQVGGGVAYLPYISSNKQQATSSPASTSSQSGGLDENITGLLEKNGLPSDHAYFMSQLSTLYAQDSWGTGLAPNNTSSKLLMLHSLGNSMLYNKSLSDSAWNEIESTEAGGDVAMSSSGRLYAVDRNGSIKTISPESYYQNRDKYQLLTNIELLSYRDTNTSAAFDNSILPDLQNITSMKSVVEYLQNTISKFGEIEMKNKNSALTVKEKNSIASGMQTLIHGNAEGVFKITQSNYSKTEVQDVNMALRYLWETLTPDQKKTIIAHTAAEGKDPTKMENVYSILALALTHHTSAYHHSETTVDYDSTASKGMGIGAGTAGADSKARSTYLEMMAYGDGVQYVDLNLRHNTSKSNIHFQGQPYQILDHQNKLLGKVSISTLLKDGQVGQIVDSSSVTFGNKVLTSTNKNHVIIDGKHMYRVTLPYDEEYYNSTGIYKPDLSAMEKFDEFIKWLNSGNYSEARINQKISDLGLNIHYNKNTNEWEFNNSKHFVMATGVTTHRAVDIDNSWKGKVSQEEASGWYDYIENNTSYGEPLYKYFWGDAASIYKSAIFMPIIDSALATVGTSGEYHPKSDWEDIRNKTEYEQTRSQIPTNW